MTLPIVRPQRGLCMLLPLVVLMCSAVGVAYAQVEDPLLQRWVGTHRGRPLYLDFYADTMLVVNDRHVLDFVTTRDSIVVFGDTSFAVHYRFALGRLLLRTEEGNIITMAPQGPLARPLWGRWLGSAIRSKDRPIELWMIVNGTARWRWVTGGGWTEGEWDRESRLITFTWLPDSTVWNGQYDPVGNQLLFDETVPGGGVVILRRIFRRRGD